MTRLSLLSPSDYQRTRWKNEAAGPPRSRAARMIRQRIPLADQHRRDRERWPVLILSRRRSRPAAARRQRHRVDIDDAAPRRMTQRFERAHFNGEAMSRCRLLAGPTRDFNVMARRDAVRADVVVRPLVGPMVIFPDVDCEWFVHLFGGHANARSGEQSLALAAGASLLVDFRDGVGERVVIEGGGEIVLVKLAAITTIDR